MYGSGTPASLSSIYGFEDGRRPDRITRGQRVRIMTKRHKCIVYTYVVYYITTELAYPCAYVCIMHKMYICSSRISVDVGRNRKTVFYNDIP